MKPAKILFLFVLSLFLTSSTFAFDKYEIDPTHSSIGFTVKHLVITKVNGKFKEFSGTLNYDEKDATKSFVEGKVKTASISTDNEKRDAHLKSKDFFDAEKYPEIIFKSKKIINKNGNLTLVGDFTMHGVTKQIEIPIKINGTVKDPWGSIRLGAEGNFTLNRQDYGVKWNQTLDNGGLLISNDVEISLVVEAVKK